VTEAKTETVTLSQPIQSLEGQPKKFIDIRTKVLVGDWRSVNKRAKEAEERTFHMVGRLTGLDEKELEQLCMADFMKLASMVDMGDDPKE
jgi:hypothetical protein